MESLPWGVERPFAMPGPLATTPVNQMSMEGQSVVETAMESLVDGAKFGAGAVVGVVERALDLASELPGAPWKGVSMVNDAAGTVLDTALGWTGLDMFEGHAVRSAARGQAIVDGVIGLPGQIAGG